MKSINVTVFTPTYNRANLLPRLFDSLKKQTVKDFEWLIIDDGSTDNTEEVVDAFKNGTATFIIRYYKTANGGKHRAINKALNIAEGRLFFIVDSDDWLPNNSIETILRLERTISIEHKKEFCGIAGTKSNQQYDFYNGKEYVDLTHIERTRCDDVGDRAEVFYTDVFKKYPFPEFDGEKFIRESVVWNRMAKDGLKIRYFNDLIYNCEYLEDGLTANNKNMLLNSPKGYGLSIYQDIKFYRLKYNSKWCRINKYYSLFKGRLNNKEIAKNLYMSRVDLYICILLCKLYRKLINN